MTIKTPDYMKIFTQEDWDAVHEMVWSGWDRSDAIEEVYANNHGENSDSQDEESHG